MELLGNATSFLSQLWWSKERQWLVSFRSPLEIWRDNPTYVMLEVVTCIWAGLLYRHARKHGGRLYLLFFAAIFHGLVVESLSYLMPDIDSFWHGVSSVMFFKQRLPLHIVLFYPCFHYTCNAAVIRLKLPWWAEPFAVGVADLLLDIPFDILGVKYLWWTWHDTDPNIYDRTYHVPLTSYIYHLTFASSFTMLLSGSRWLLTGSRDPERVPQGVLKELVCVLLTGLLSMPLAVVLQFLPVYHALHDVGGVHTEICVLVLFGFYCMLAWIGDRHAGVEARPSLVPGHRSRRWTSLLDELSLSVVIHYMFYLFLVSWADPVSYRSTGPHQTVGDCNITTYVDTAAGMRLPKKPYLCLSNYSEPYFDFHCVAPPSMPGAGAGVYTVCGTPYGNLVELQVVVVGSCLLGLVLFYQWLFKSAKTGKLKKS